MELLKSKKFIVTIIGAVFVAVCTYLGFDAKELVIEGGMFMSYILGQGISDMGKEAAKIETPQIK